MPECRANNNRGWTQGGGFGALRIPPAEDEPGSSADNIVADFAVKYHNEAAALGIDLEELYRAMLTNGELNAPGQSNALRSNIQP